MTPSLWLLLAQAQSQAPAAAASGNNTLIGWGVLLIAIGFGLVVLEFFVPSAGVLAIIASTSIVVGIVLLFLQDTTIGLLATLCALVLLPIVLATGLKILPHTPIFRWLTLDDPKPEQADATKQATLIGHEGVALKDLRPIGTCLIDDQRIECLAQGGVIEAGSRVRVVSHDRFQTKVTPIG
ncbi:MAG: NfeD family protein [Phycisphaeraceae bacterium]